MCFTLAWLEQLLVDVVILVAVVSILKILIPWLLAKLGGDFAIIGQVINVVLWALVAIVVIYFCFAMISCLVGGQALPLLPTMHR